MTYKELLEDLARALARSNDSAGNLEVTVCDDDGYQYVIEDVELVRYPDLPRDVITLVAYESFEVDDVEMRVDLEARPR